MDRSRDNDAEGAASAGEAARAAGEAAAAGAQQLSESLEQGRAALAELQTVLGECSRECLRTTDEFVRRSPWQAVGIAAGVGLVLGMLMSRR